MTSVRFPHCGHLGLACWLGAWAWVAGAALCVRAADAPARRSPNIVFILADDLGYGDLGCYGQKRLRTPHLDALAAEGMRFTQHYSGAPVCAPSRSSLFTGLHTGHTPIRGNREVQPEGQLPLPAGTVTLPALLRDAGYATGLFGKWGLGYPGSEGTPLRQGFDVFFGYNCQRLGHHYYPDHLWDGETRVDLAANAGAARGAYAPELIHARTLAFMEENRDRPFFCVVASVLPHAELVAPEKYLARHRGRYGLETPFAGVDSGPDFRCGPYASQAEPRAAYAAMVELLDEQVGEIVAKIRALGLERDTLIVFSSDNGPHREGGNDPDYFASNGGLRGGKRDVYEGGIRVPAIAWWPGRIAVGQATGVISAFWDWWPTFVELGGAKDSPTCDGVSLVPTLTRVGEQRTHEYLYWEFHEAGGRMALRQGDWKVVALEVGGNTRGAAQLFDLSSDPGETTDLADREPERAAALMELMRSVRTASAEFTFSDRGFLQPR